MMISKSSTYLTHWASQRGIPLSRSMIRIVTFSQRTSTVPTQPNLGVMYSLLFSSFVAKMLALLYSTKAGTKIEIMSDIVVRGPNFTNLNPTLQIS